MLIVPVTGKISRHNLPMVTIGLILINCLVFFCFQLNDERRTREALTFYFTSGLSEMELPRYIEYRKTRSEENSGRHDLEKRSDEELWNLYLAMRADVPQTTRIIQPGANLEINMNIWSQRLYPRTTD